ncbi:MAG: LPS export ABC transporter periplasmic protein LptC [Clostridium sp.]|nr:LPS export ABC transporter periplasmic protein LptC [Clostridium sp.]
MSKRKIAYIVILAVLIIGCVWAFIAAGVITKNFKKEALKDAGEKQQLNIENLIITETKEDKKYWELYAESGYYDNQNKVAILYNVIGNFYDKDQVVLSMESTKGTFDEATKKVVLYEDTFIIYKDGTNVKADRFTWQGNDKDIVAQGNVVIQRYGEIRTFSNEAILGNQMTNVRIKGRSKTELYSKGNFNEKF